MPSIALAMEGNHAKKTGKAQQICFTPTLSAASTIPATAFCTTFSAKVSETQGRKSLEHCCLLSTIYKNCYSKDLVYQIDGAKVGFPPLLLRLLICQVLVLIFSSSACEYFLLVFFIFPFEKSFFL